MSQTTTLHSSISCHPSSLLLYYLHPPSVIGTFLLHYSVGMGATSPIVTCTCMLACIMPHTHNHPYSHSFHPAGMSATSPAIALACWCTQWPTPMIACIHLRTHYHLFVTSQFSHALACTTLTPTLIRSLSFVCSFVFVPFVMSSLPPDREYLLLQGHMVEGLGTWFGPFVDAGLCLCYFMVSVLSHFIAALLFPSFPSLPFITYYGSCHATGGPIWMQSASLANIPLLTVFIWSIEACHRHCPKSFRDEGGYHIVNIVNKQIQVFHIQIRLYNI